MKIGDKVVKYTRHGVVGPFDITGETRTLWKVSDGESYLKNNGRQRGFAWEHHAPRIEAYVPKRHDVEIKKRNLMNRKHDVLIGFSHVRLSQFTDEFLEEAEALLARIQSK